MLRPWTDMRVLAATRQSIMDWDRSRLAYRAVKRTFDIAFSGCVLAVIAVPSLVLAAAIRLESEGNPFYSQIRVGQTHRDGSLEYYFSEPVVENDAKGVAPLLLAYTEMIIQ